ncbi:MAG: HAMP domain-containing protein [Desulfobacterales bacterium]|nr:HAMP domain-containing protein [Desulfobacterales bacterium]
MTLKKKILLGYSVPCVLIALAILWATINLITLGKSSDAVLKENYQSIRAADNMLDALKEQDRAILFLLLGDSQSAITQFQENEALFLQWLTRAKDNITIEGERSLIQSIERGFSKYRMKFLDIADLRYKNQNLPVLEKIRYENEIHPIYAEIQTACRQLRNLNEERMYANNSQAVSIANKTIGSLIIVATVAIIVALSFSFLLSHGIVQPLRRLITASRKIAAGQYAVRVDVETGDEIGQFAEEFNQMIAKLAHYNEMNIEKIIAEKQKGEAILASIEDGLIFLDTSLKVTGINPAARFMLGLQFEEYASLRLNDILPDRRICDLIENTIKTGAQPLMDEEERIVTIKQGENLRYYLFSIDKIPGKETNLSGVVLLLRDITHMKQVEHLKSEFIMAASHELRTPLTSIGMSIDLLMEHAADNLNENDLELLQAAHEEVHRLKALISDLLDLSKIEAGRIDLEYGEVPVKALVEHLEKIFKAQLEEKSVKLITQLPENLPNIRADGNKIAWVLTNLLSNALRYVDENGHIQISGKKVGTTIHLSVKDDGPGIPTEYQTKIFEKFVKVKGQKSEGTGLGLAICKEIVRAHGGTIWVESKLGEGSKFIFTVPIAK